MLFWILSSFVVSEAIVGIILTVLLVIGKADSRIVVDVMSFVGFLIFAGGFLPLLQKLRVSALLGEPKKDKTDQEEATPTEPSKSKLYDFAKKQANLLRAMLIGGIVFGMGLGLFYLTETF
ncbi:hypothetical protein KAR02_09270 [Candidatus Bipolaricaulota bacterium]|nr:hypothetical protein [Candidatus Bipolaricaulota bacterium]